MNKDPNIKLFEQFFKVEFTPCESSNLVAYAKLVRDSSHQDILILYKGGKCYRYLGAGKIYDELTQATSKGKWVNANLVKGNFNFRKYEAT